MAKLYTNPKGLAVTKHSYSAGSDFRKCRRYYFLKRVQGWQEKTRAAAFEFGKAIESALQFYHANNLKPGSMAEEFARIWAKVKEIPNIEYKDSESWDDLSIMGTDMGRLYEAVLPTLPFKDPKFQLNYEKELYPGTYLGGIKFTAYVDMLAKQASDESVIIDIKTAGQAYDETPELHALDPQLRAYSWVSGIRKMAFLVFVKTSPTIKRGDTVTLLDAGMPPHKAGDRFKILIAEEENEQHTRLVLTLTDYNEYKKLSAGLKGRAADKIVTDFADKGLHVPPDMVTKQRLQYLPATISPERAADTGKMIGEQVAQIVQAEKDGSYPEDGSTRFPNAICTWCCMRGICTGNDALRDELIFRETETDNWLDELTDGD